MRQIALPLDLARRGNPPRIVVGEANATVVEALESPASWPFGTAVLSGPPRSGKSLLARWFVGTGAGEAIDNAESVPEDALFHAWNRSQQSGQPLLLVTNAGEGGWTIRLPDLKSRIGAALKLEIDTPDDAMLADLIAVHAEMRRLVLPAGATDYLVPRCRRSFRGVEQLVAAIDRLSLERKQPATMAIWRDALEEISGQAQPRLL